MENSKILQELFDSKILAIIKLFFKYPEKQFYLLEISKGSKVSSATTFRIVNKLVSLELLKQIPITRIKLYQLNDNENVEFLKGFIKDDVQVLKMFLDQVKTIPGIEAIILHGKEMPNRANLLIIGTDVDSEQIKTLCAEIKEKYNFTISPLTLAKEQYDQMSQMGLYSGQKKIIFERE